MASKGCKLGAGILQKQASLLLNKGQNVKEGDAPDDNSSNMAGSIKKHPSYFELLVIPEQLIKNFGYYAKSICK